MPEFGASKSTSNEEKEALKRELKTYFFISPQDRIDDLDDGESNGATTGRKTSPERSNLQAIQKVKQALVRKKSTRLNVDNLLG